MQAAELFEGALLSIILIPIPVTDVDESVAVLTREVGIPLDLRRPVFHHGRHLHLIVILQCLRDHQLANDFSLLIDDVLVTKELRLRLAVCRHCKAVDGAVKLDEDEVIALLNGRDLQVQITSLAGDPINVLDSAVNDGGEDESAVAVCILRRAIEAALVLLGHGDSHRAWRLVEDPQLL